MHKLKFLNFYFNSDNIFILSSHLYIAYYFHFVDNINLYQKQIVKNSLEYNYCINNNLPNDILYKQFNEAELSFEEINNDYTVGTHYMIKFNTIEENVSTNTLQKYLFNSDFTKYYEKFNCIEKLKTDINYHIICTDTYIINNDILTYNNFQNLIYKMSVIHNSQKYNNFVDMYKNIYIYKSHTFNKSIPLLIYSSHKNSSHKILKLSLKSSDNILCTKFNQFDSISGWHLNLSSKKFQFRPTNPLSQITYTELYREAFTYNAVKYSWSDFFNKLSKKFKNTDSEFFASYSHVEFISNLENIENLLDMLKVIKQDTYTLSYTFKISGYVCSISQNNYIVNYNMRINNIIYLSTLTDNIPENIYPSVSLVGQKDIIQNINYIKLADYIADSTKFLINHNCNINLILESLYYDLLNYITQSSAAQYSITYIYHILLNSVINLYYEQNIKLNNFYFNIFVKKMCNFIKIINSHHSVSNIKTGDIIAFPLINLIYNSYTEMGIKEKQLFLYCPLIVGLKDLNKVSSGFLTNASYQNTLRVLMQAALTNSFEWITNLKSSVITGTMSPSGFGWLEKFIK